MKDAFIQYLLLNLLSSGVNTEKDLGHDTGKG